MINEMTVTSGSGSVTVLGDKYLYPFEDTSSINASWTKRVALPTITVSGDSNSTTMNFFGANSASFSHVGGADTAYTFSVDFSGASDLTSLSYSYSYNGIMQESDIPLTDSDNSFSISDYNYASIVVTFSALANDGTTYTATCTISDMANGLSPFKVGSNYYNTWEKAVTAAVASSGKVITLNQTYTLPTTLYENGLTSNGTYTTKTTEGIKYSLPSGVTFHIPYSASADVHTTAPATVAAVAKSVYRKLTVLEGISIDVSGKVSVDAQMDRSCGSPTGAYGLIVLQAGSSMTFNSGAALYCWGYINGDGEIEMLNGTTVYEGFQLKNWRGGTATSGMLNNSQKVFPINQYYVQNVEAPMTIYYGATEKIYTSVYMASSVYTTTATFITTTSASDGMFRLAEGARVTKRYLATTDHLLVEAYGNVTINSITIKISSYSMNSANYVLPITNNLDITVKSGSTVTTGQTMALLAGSIMTVDYGGTFNITKDVFVYDADEWLSGNYATQTAPLAVVGYSTANLDKTMRTAANLGDAEINVNGTVSIGGGSNGCLYTTAGGAKITSSEGTGQIIYGGATTNSTTTYQALQGNYNGATDGTGIQYSPISCTTAKLLNGNGTYSQTTSAQNTWSFYYDKDYEHWYRYRVNYVYGGNTVYKSHYCIDADLPFNYTIDGMASVEASTDGNSTASVNGTTVTVTSVTDNSVVTVEGIPYRYTPVFVLNETQYNLYQGYTNNTLSNTKSINGTTYYVVRQDSESDFGSTLNAPSDEDMGVAAAHHNSIVWKLSDSTAGNAFLGSVPSGEIDGAEVYIYGIYSGFVAYNSFTDEYYTTLYEAMSFVPQSGSTTVRLLANCSSFEAESGTSLFTIYSEANVILDLNGYKGVGRINNKGTLTIELNGGSFDYHTGNQAGENLAAITNSGTLTINDTGGGGIITTDIIGSSSTGAKYASVIRNESGGRLTINGGLIKSQNTTQSYITAVLNLSGGTIVGITGGILEPERGCALYNIGTVESISGGQIRGIYSGNSALYSTGTIKTISGGIIHSDLGHAISTSGTIKNITAGTTITSDATGSYRAINNSGTIETISGGVFTAAGDYCVYSTSKLNTISGGTFTATTAKKYALRNTSTSNKTSITGGYFKGGTAGRGYAVYSTDNTSLYKYDNGKGISKTTTIAPTALTGYHTIVDCWTITYNANGGSGTMYATRVEKGQSMALTDKTYTRTGYTFSKWNTATGGTGTNYSNKATVTPTDNMTLYAQWTANTYYVAFNKNADAATGTMSNETFTYGQSKALTLNAYTYEGYYFNGWSTVAVPTEEEPGTTYTDGQSVSNLTATANATVTLYAQWAACTSITGATVVVSGTYIYSGTAQTPASSAVTVTLNGSPLTYGTDYTFVASNNTNAGTATVTVTGLGHYKDTATETFTIGKKELTVTARNNTITYGDAPALANSDPVTYSGFVNGETENVLSGALGFDSNYSQYGNVGSYTITPKGLTCDNYSFNYVPGTLTVEQKEVGLSWDNTNLTYNGSAQKPTATATGLVNNDAISVTVTGEQTNAGTGYTATATGLTGDKAGNYKLPTAYTTTFSIDPLELVLSWGEERSFPYDGQEHAPTATISGVIGNDQVSVTVTGASAVGNHNATASLTGADAGNYVLPSENTVSFEITQSSFTVTFNTQKEGVTVAPITNVELGSTITEPTAPTVDGYRFEGWYKESGCDNAWNFSTDTVTEDTTLYAKWAANSATIKMYYHLSYGGQAGDFATFTYSYGDTLSDPEYVYCTFDNWTYNGTTYSSNGENALPSMKAALDNELKTSTGKTIEVTANFTRQTYSITVYTWVSGETAPRETVVAQANNRRLGYATKLTASETMEDDGNTYNFSYWLIGTGEDYGEYEPFDSRTASFFPTVAGAYNAIMVFGASGSEEESDGVSFRILNETREKYGDVWRAVITLELNGLAGGYELYYEDDTPADGEKPAQVGFKGLGVNYIYSPNDPGDVSKVSGRVFFTDMIRAINGMDGAPAKSGGTYTLRIQVPNDEWNFYAYAFVKYRVGNGDWVTKYATKDGVETADNATKYDTIKFSD